MNAETSTSTTSFASLDLPAPVIRGLDEAGFTHCTPIQAATLPHLLKGEDVAGQAQTGTGKTAAFLVAAFNHILRHPPDPQRRPNQPLAIMVAPTRELAVQIHKDAEQLGGHTGLRMGVVYGGAGYDTQRAMLTEGVDVLIGTPGRLIDYFKQKVYDLKAIQVMVLDEADRMFDLGFINDIRYLMRRMPPPEQRLNMLFSATLSFRVLELAYEHMNNAVTVRVEPDKVTADKVTQVVYHPANDEKIPLLLGLLKHMDPRRSIVFVNTKRVADRVYAYLEGNGIRAAVLSGDVPQRKRLKLLADFQAGELPVLVATDVAARGLHIPDVSHVFNFDLPQDAEDYVHRIGRTARAGASGDAVSFACEDYAFSLPEIEAYIGHRIPAGALSEDLLIKPEPPIKLERRPRLDRRGRDGGGRRGDGRRGEGRRGEGSRGGSRPGESSAPAQDRPAKADGGGEGRKERPPRRRRRGTKPGTEPTQ
jgi:ATP-dependent RNA helicase RhlB